VPRVLVVEDEVLVRMAVADSLELAGFKVVEASTGDEAVSLLSRGGPQIDLVFTDVRMPGSVDGFALNAWVRQNRPAIPVFLVSGDIGKAHSRDELAPGQPFFSKPYSLDAVVSRMKIELGSPSLAFQTFVFRFFAGAAVALQQMAGQGNARPLRCSIAAKGKPRALVTCGARRTASVRRAFLFAATRGRARELAAGHSFLPQCSGSREPGRRLPMQRRI
jgi:CheY-like chemotaxis protein